METVTIGAMPSNCQRVLTGRNPLQDAYEFAIALDQRAVSTKDFKKRQALFRAGLSLLRSISKNGYNTPYVQSGIGHTLLHLSRVSEAQAVSVHAQKAWPRNPSILLLAGNIAKAQSKHELALSLYRQAEKVYTSQKYRKT